MTDPELQLLPEEEPPLEPPLDEPPLLEPPPLPLLPPLEELPPISRPPEIGLPAVPEPGPAGTEPSEEDPEDPAAQGQVMSGADRHVLEFAMQRSSDVLGGACSQHSTCDALMSMRCLEGHIRSYPGRHHSCSDV